MYILYSISVHELHTLTGQWHSFRYTPGVSVEYSHPSSQTLDRALCLAARDCSAAAEFGQEIGHAEEDPHHQEVGAEGQQGQRVQEAGVQPEVTHRQQAAQVLLDHPLPRPNAAESREAGGRRRRRGGGGGVEQQKKVGGRERRWKGRD